MVGGHSRNVGKTSAVASLIARLRNRNWLVMKTTQFGHGFCTANGEACDFQTDEHAVAFSFERPEAPGYDATTDTARFLSAGAVRSLWVRTRKEIAAAEKVIIESNSVIGLLEPDLYLSVLDHGTADFKESARLFLDRADAMLLRQDSRRLVPNWNGVSPRLVEGTPQFLIQAPEYMAQEAAAFVEERLTSLA